MRVLVTGANGFVGRHLVRDLTAAGHEVWQLDRTFSENITSRHIVADLLDGDLEHIVASVNPQGCIHLAGIAFVPVGWQDPAKVLAVNLIGTVRLLEAFRSKAPDARLLIVSSSEVYGRRNRGAPLTEDAPLAPENPYAVSKEGADMSARLYARRYAMAVMCARPDNHCGPGQSRNFVVASFAAQFAAIAAGNAPAVIRVGNLQSERDFSDVRDVARAYRLILEKGRPGSAYNIASGQRTKIAAIVEKLSRISGVSPRIEVDPARFRPADSTPILDTARLRRETGWAPRYDLETTLTDVFRDIQQQTTSHHGG